MSFFDKKKQFGEWLDNNYADVKHLISSNLPLSAHSLFFEIEEEGNRIFGNFSVLTHSPKSITLDVLNQKICFFLRDCQVSFSDSFRGRYNIYCPRYSISSGNIVMNLEGMKDISVKELNDKFDLNLPLSVRDWTDDDYLMLRLSK